MATTSNYDPTIIKEGDRVLIKKAKSMSCVKVEVKKTVNLDKTWLCLDGAIGCQYGTLFEPNGKKVVPVPAEEQEDLLADVEVDRDNRNLIDTSENQKLVHEDIEQMKKDGVKGKDIIDQLVENSATFKVKTEYAQEKYIRRKKKKHFRQFQILKPSTRLLADMYFQRGPSKICNLRADSLAQMLTQGNVHAHNKMLVFETCLGLVTGAVMERLGGFGEVVQVHTGEIAAKTAVEQFNFPQQFWDKVHYFPVRKLPLLQKEVVSVNDFNFYQPPEDRDAAQQNDGEGVEEAEADEINEEEEEMEEDGQGQSTEEDDKPQDEEDGNHKPDGGGAQDDAENDTAEPPNKKPRTEKIYRNPRGLSDEEYQKFKEQSRERKQKRFERLRKAHTSLRTGEFDGLLVACRVYPTPVILQLLKYISPSRPIVIFSQFKEPLLDAYMKLCNTKKLVNMRLSETWWRNYQVLPNRTHPEIKMNNYSGYILTGITVDSK